MKRTGFFLGVALTVILLALAGFYTSSPKGTFETNRDTTSVKSSVPDIKPAITDTGKEPDTPLSFNDFDTSEYGDISDEMKIALWVAKVDTKPMSEKIDAIVKSSRESSAELIKQLEDMGRADAFAYLRSQLEYFNVFYNTNVMGEDEDQKEDVRNTLMDKLAIDMTSWGLDQTRAEKLQSLKYNVAEGGKRTVSMEGTVKDFIALSKNAKFGLDDHGRECLFFTSSDVKQYREKVHGHNSETLFGPYCVYRNNRFEPPYDPFGLNLSYNKSELEDLIKEFHQ